MARVGLTVVALVFLLVAPAVGAQSQPSLAQRLGDLRFPEIIVSIDPTIIEFSAERGTITGQTASDLRRCIDKHSTCPDSTIAGISDGDADGFVDEAEVDGFSGALQAGLNFMGGSIAEFRRNLRELATIDGHGADSASFSEIRIEGAEGSITKTDTVFFTIQVQAKFPEVEDADQHRITMQREQSDLDLADRIVVRSGDGWSLPRDSIRPQDLRTLHRDDSITGTQEQLEGTEPMSFDIEKRADGGSPWLWVISLLLVAGGAGAFLLARARRGI